MPAQNLGYPRLLREIGKRNIRQSELQQALNINRQALSMKLHGKRNAKFSVEQAITVKKQFFPDIPIEELFERK